MKQGFVSMTRVCTRKQIVNKRMKEKMEKIHVDGGKREKMQRQLDFLRGRPVGWLPG